jgi:nitroreductase
MDFDKVIRKRASVKKYSDKKVKYDKIIDAIEAANMAPSPGNLPILKYIIVEDQEKINIMADCCQQDFIKDAQVVVVVCSVPKKVHLMYDKRADNYIKQHSGAAIENFLLKITEMGLSSCWVGAFSEKTAKNALVIPEEVSVEAILPIAYETKKDPTKQKQKPNLGNTIYFDKWKNKYQTRVKMTGTHYE